MHRDSGRIKISRMLIGVTIAIGWVKLLSQPFPPFRRIPAASIRTMLITASAIVTFMSLVGGFIPNRPIILDSPIKSSTVAMYSLYSVASGPSMSFVKPSSQFTAVSARICRFPGFQTFIPLVRNRESSTRTAITTQLITTDSAIWMPPNIGIVKAVSTLSLATSSAAISFICLQHSFPLQ